MFFNVESRAYIRLFLYNTFSIDAVGSSVQTLTNKALWLGH